MIVYIAGKMNGLPDKGRETFAKAEEYLKSYGHIVLNPACLPDGMKPHQYMPICLAMLEQADAVCLLEGWEYSKGAILEKLYANYQFKKIFYFFD